MQRLRPKVYKNWLHGDVNIPNFLHERRRRADNRLNGAEDARAQNNLNIPPIEIPVVDNDFDNNERPENNAADGNGLVADENNSDSSQSDEEEQRDEPDNDCDCHYCQERNIQAEEFVFQWTQEYADKLDLNSQLYEGLQVTKFEIFVMILTLAMRHGFTGQLVTDLLQFVNKIFGRDILPPSYHIFKKLFSVDSALAYHFVCEHCNLYLGKYGEFESNEIACPNCGGQCNVNPHSLQDTSFFVTLSIKNQMQDLLKRAGKYIMPRRREANGCLTDIRDGELYKSMCAEGQPLSNHSSLTLTISTDGGQVFENSCHNSLWPIQIVCNEIHPKERFRAENMMLAGLWFGKNSPSMSAFFKPLSDELKEMETNGMIRTLSNGEEVMCPVYVILCVCDSVAKPKIQNISQFNAYYGCGYCFQRGIYIDECSQVRFPFEGREYGLRSQQSVVDAMNIADATQRCELGVKGLSPLLHFPSVHLVFGVPVDWMHNILLGVVKRLVGLWFDEHSHGERYYIKKHEASVDARLSSITAPSKLVTRPKAISKRSAWKAKDWLAFLLYFGLVCIDGLLPSAYLENFRDLSNGIFKLLQETITEQDLEASRTYLLRFVQNYNLLYGVRNMVYNLHLVIHLVQIVKMCGPLHMFSAFSFEGGIGLLIRMVKGTNSVASQICRKYLAAKSLPYVLLFHNVSLSVQEYCESILTFRRNKHSCKVDDIALLGGEKLHLLTLQERQLLQGSGYCAGELVATFNRSIYQGNVFTSTNYTRPKKTNDTCVELISGEFGVIDLIVLLPEAKVVVFFRPLRVCIGFGKADHIFSCAGDPFGEKTVVPFLNIRKKLIFFSVEGSSYVTYRPNNVEHD